VGRFDGDTAQIVQVAARDDVVVLAPIRIRRVGAQSRTGQAVLGCTKGAVARFGDTGDGGSFTADILFRFGSLVGLGIAFLSRLFVVRNTLDLGQEVLPPLEVVSAGPRRTGIARRVAAVCRATDYRVTVKAFETVLVVLAGFLELVGIDVFGAFLHAALAAGLLAVLPPVTLFAFLDFAVLFFADPIAALAGVALVSPIGIVHASRCGISHPIRGQRSWFWFRFGMQFSEGRSANAGHCCGDHGDEKNENNHSRHRGERRLGIHGDNGEEEVVVEHKSVLLSKEG